jgi:tetratricopeptide (TPR) repeat protein
MTAKIIHTIVFLIVATIVISGYLNYKSDPDGYGSAALLPALLLGGIYVGVLFVMYVLPVLTQKATTAVLASNEEVERDPLRDARAAFARGDYEDAIEFYREASEADPLDRLPWVEIAKIQHDQLEDPEASLHTLRTALEEHDWQDDDDTVFFMGRIAEILHDDLQDEDGCVEILEKIIEMFPSTRHSAGATHKLKEMGRL